MICPSLRSRVLASLLLVGFAMGLGASGCVLPNPNHCQNLAVDPNVWCGAHYGEERPYCSPCTADNNGCVSEEPSAEECPEYTPQPDAETDSETDSGTETDSDSGTETETDSGAETETTSGG
jgi:hypothetical protein